MKSIEEMQAAWQEQSAQLEQATFLLTQHLRADRLQQVRTPLRSLIVSLRVEVALSVLGMVVLGNFLGTHLGEPRFEWPALLMDLWFLVTLIATARQLSNASRVNYDQPIARVQEQLTDLRVFRLKTFRWIFLTGQIVWWVPFSIIAPRIFFGVDAYRYFTPAYLAVNIGIGMLIVPLLLFVTRRIPAKNRSTWLIRFADIIAGSSLMEAQRQARMIAEFK